jgi:hypothetical protein
LIEKRSPKEFLWGFDSFEGLPNDWAGYIITKETFDVQGQLPKVRRNVRLVKGFFDKSIGPWLSTHGSDIESISILHIDSDLYESCKVILDMLERFIKPKTFILFDEYFNYPNWQNHEFLAFKEFCQKGNINYRYRGFYEQKVLVEII